MEVKVHCPGCKAILRVPHAAVGKAARCPACHTMFRIPSPQQDIEETVSNWIEEDVDHLKQEHDQQWQQMAAAERERRLQEQRERSARAAERLQELLRQEAQAESEAQQVIQRASSPGISTSAHPASAATAQAPRIASAAMAAKPQAQASADEATVYPSDIHAPAQRPHLMVETCTQRGVRLAFDSRWLEHDGFTISMPLRCPFTGEADRHQLICKPLAFVDRSQAAVRNPLEIERGHEKTLGDWTPRQVRDAMGALENLPPPFNRAMPYFLAQSEAGQSLQCITNRRADGITTCSVLIPDGAHALEWLARVNGVCGMEYQLLERDVAHLFTNQWRDVPQRSRQRLTAWCEFEPGERFGRYYPDADFPKKDEGLAGVVITDRRAIYHKYHRHGEVKPSPDIRVIIRPDAEFAGVTFATPEGTVKAVRLHFDDIHDFTEELRKLGFQLDIETRV